METSTADPTNKRRCTLHAWINTNTTAADMADTDASRLADSWTPLIATEVTDAPDEVLSANPQVC